MSVWASIFVVGSVVYFAADLPGSNEWAVPERPPNIRIEAADGRLITNRGVTGGEAVRIHELPPHVYNAVIAIEDRRFVDHFGLDARGLARAMFRNAMARRFVEGGSTITQQLAKNLFLKPERTIERKVKEALLALWLESQYTKPQIIEMYLNRVFYGHGATGIQAAAHTYFNKPASELNLSEAALLAGSLKAPSRLNIKSNRIAAAKRAKLVLNAMADVGFISQDEAQLAQIDPKTTVRAKIAGAEEYVADWVDSLLPAYLPNITEDIVVRTTIDWDLQKHGEWVLRETLRTQKTDKNVSQAALVAMTPNGEIRAVVGGVDYTASQFNRAVTARRQPGSSFKPIVYLTALENGFTPLSRHFDTPFNFDNWVPKNYSGKYYGEVVLRDALAQSLNTVAARLTIELGPEQVVDTAYRLGITSQLHPHPSISLGTGEVSLLEMTSAYAPLANDGRGVIADVIQSIATAQEHVIYRKLDVGPGRVISRRNVAMMNDMLEHAVRSGTGGAARFGDWQIAGKTGTTQDFRDAWFIGFSSQLVTGIWMGNDDGSQTDGITGGSLPAKAFADFMSHAHEGLPQIGLLSYYGRDVQYQFDHDLGTNVARDRRNASDFFSDFFGLN